LSQNQDNLLNIFKILLNRLGLLNKRLHYFWQQPTLFFLYGKIDFIQVIAFIQEEEKRKTISLSVFLIIKFDFFWFF